MAKHVFDTLAPYRAQIDVALEKFFEKLPMALGVPLSAHSAEAVRLLQDYSLRPAKRIRGSLAAAAYDAAAGTHLDVRACRLGAVLELIQNYLLIIDDVMDKSTLRRGQPTIHVLYADEAKGYGGAHEANMLGVNVGLIAQHAANLLLAEIDVSPEYLASAFKILHRHIAITSFGQLDDLHMSLGRKVSEADILRKYSQKSSHYTFINPLQLGFTLAGAATAQSLAACAAYGGPAGIAFQLHDDYLGIFGDAERIGKPNLDDIREGKHTVLVHYALAHADDDARKRLSNILGNPRADAADLKTVQHVLEETGARAYNQRMAKDFSTKAEMALVGKLGSEAFEVLLGELAGYAIERER